MKMPAMKEGSLRAQAAMEYLMTYGWAILVIMALGVVLWQMGVLSTTSVTAGKSGFTDISPLDWQAKSDDTIRIILANNADSRQNVTSVSVKVSAGGSGTCSYSGSSPSLPFVIKPGETKDLSTFTGCSITEAVGEYYRLDVTVGYTSPASSITHTSVGKVWGPLD